MKFTRTLAVLISFIPSILVAEELPSLQVHPNQRMLITSDGRPFFWMADTAWELLHRGSREDITHYLNVRQEQGFNVIQTVLIAEFDGLRVPTPRGFRPLRDNDPETPWVIEGQDNDYWDDVQWAIEEAAKRKFYVALVPTWGEWVTPRFSKPPIFQNKKQAYRYGNFLGKRFAKHSNIVWIMGGDRQPTEWPHAREVWQAMAEGITDGTTGIDKLDGKADWDKSLMTYHSMASSSTWWHQEPWIDFHTWGTYHTQRDWARSFQVAKADYALENPKPTLNGEPCYEDFVRDYGKGEGYFNAKEVRRAAYWSVLSGSLGHTYGAHAIWHMAGNAEVEPAHVPVPDIPPARTTWKEALQLPGANQMKHLKHLMESIEPDSYRPDDILILRPSTNGLEESYQVAGRSKCAILVYSPEGLPIRLAMSNDELRLYRATWFDPRTGESTSASPTTATETTSTDNFSSLVFQPPAEIPQDDWVLVLRRR